MSIYPATLQSLEPILIALAKLSADNIQHLLEQENYETDVLREAIVNRAMYAVDEELKFFDLYEALLSKMEGFIRAELANRGIEEGDKK